MSETEPKPWDQLPDEPITAYRRFMIYRDIGPRRTLEKAYEVYKGAKGLAPGMWQRQAVEYSWKDRATAYDIEMMSEHGTKAVINWVLSLVELSEQTLEEMQSGRLKPRSFEQVLGALDVLGKFVTPETVEAAREFARGNFGRDDDEAE
jgi:hypothetical protein